MMPVKQASFLAHQVQPNYEPKLSSLELAAAPRPSTLLSQTQEFSRFTVNHCTPYIYTKNRTVFPVNRCTPCTYTKNLARLPLTTCTSYTYIKDCALCVLTHRQGSTPPKPLTHLPHIAKPRQNCATGVPPAHPSLQSHTQPSSSHP